MSVLLTGGGGGGGFLALDGGGGGGGAFLLGEVPVFSGGKLAFLDIPLPVDAAGETDRSPL